MHHHHPHRITILQLRKATCLENVNGTTVVAASCQFQVGEIAVLGPRHGLLYQASTEALISVWGQQADPQLRFLWGICGKNAAPTDGTTLYSGHQQQMVRTLRLGERMRPFRGCLEAAGVHPSALVADCVDHRDEVLVVFESIVGDGQE